MCGICGELRFDGRTPDPAVLDKMLPFLAQRGPDFEDKWRHEAVQFGHRRLSIIDLSEASNQPMVDRQLGLTIVFNGAIYNYPELRKSFIEDGYQFQSEGDTEVILKAYHKWGEDCPAHLDGMFAFAIWDQNKNKLFCARDRFGIKPFYFSQTNNSFVFASNMQALLATRQVDTDINPVGLHNQFSLHAVIPAPNTILKGVKKLEPGTSMSFELSASGKPKVNTNRYWHLRATRPAQAMDEEEWTQAIYESLSEAVKKRLMIADVPVGVLLSGGLDSSLLVALLAEQGVDDLQTFSIGFEDQPEEKGSEFEFSDQIVERYQTKHHKIQIANDQVLRRLPEAVKFMSEPMFGQDAVAFYLLSEQVSQHVKVVQSGQGADEVFAGYFWYPQMHEDMQGEHIDRFARYYFDREHDEFLEMATAAHHTHDVSRERLSELLNKPDADEFIDQVLRADITTLIVDDPVKRVDNMTMAFGLEARVPFLDYKMVELAAQVPPELKLGSGGKHILKSISRGRIPDAVIDRPKGYFPMPALKYVRGEFFEFMQDILLDKACQERGLYEKKYINKLLSEPDKHFTRLQGSKLWHLALLEFWLQTNVDGA